MSLDDENQLKVKMLFFCEAITSAYPVEKVLGNNFCATVTLSQYVFCNVGYSDPAILKSHPAYSHIFLEKILCDYNQSPL